MIYNICLFLFYNLFLSILNIQNIYFLKLSIRQLPILVLEFNQTYFSGLILFNHRLINMSMKSNTLFQGFYVINTIHFFPIYCNLPTFIEL